MAEKKLYAYDSDNKLKAVLQKNIVVYEAAGKRTIVHCLDKKIYTCNKTLKVIEELICSETNKRVHNHYIINIDHIDEVLRYKQRHYRMYNGMTIPSSRRMNGNYKPD